MDITLLERLYETVKGGGEAVLCTVTENCGSTPREAGAGMLVFKDGSIAGTIGGGMTERRVIDEAVEMIRERRDTKIHSESLAPKDGESGADDGAVCGGDVDIFMERVAPRDEVIIFGAGHVGRATARLARDTGFSVTVWDDRAEYADGCADFGRSVACPIAEAEARGIRPGASSYVVIATRGHAMDREAAALVSRYDCAYVGMIGSRKKIAHVRARLADDGVPREKIELMRQPIGLPIRAETPEEIAVSIMAEIIAVKRGADLDAMREPLVK